MKANAITLDRIKHCKCVYHESRNGRKILVRQCSFHKRINSKHEPIDPTSVGFEHDGFLKNMPTFSFENLPPISKAFLEDIENIETSIENWMKEQKNLPNNPDEIIDLYLNSQAT